MDCKGCLLYHGGFDPLLRKVEVNISFNVVVGEVADVIPHDDQLKAISHAKTWPQSRRAGGFDPLRG